MLKKLFLLAALGVFLSPALRANNLQLTGVQYKGGGKLSFFISWENSWNLSRLQEPANHDAVWVFVKFKTRKDGSWHGAIDTAKTGHTAGNNLRVLPSKDGVGAWILRTDTASGDITSTEVTLQLDISELPENQYTIEVFGVEMVWVNPGGFYLGDGKSVNRYRTAGGLPLYIQSEQAIDTGDAAGQLSRTEEFSLPGPVPAVFPKGTRGFYMMKYELSQGAWADFMNSLHLRQQQEHCANSLTALPGTPVLGNGFRNGLVIQSPASGEQPAVIACDMNGNKAFNEPEDGVHVPCNFLNWGDITAWLDWAGLRPLTDFEFEKAARGPLSPVAQELAWGTPYAIDAATLQQGGTAVEGVSEVADDTSGLCNFGYTGVLGPIRNGYAAKSNTDRVGSGAAYYGIFELSGNLWEPCVVAQGEGRSFAGEPGNGEIDQDGKANVAGWPVTDGQGVKGGGFFSGISPTYRDPAVSDRWYAFFLLDARKNTTGLRGVRYSE